jgi:hypothetical protein
MHIAPPCELKIIIQSITFFCKLLLIFYFFSELMDTNLNHKTMFLSNYFKLSGSSVKTLSFFENFFNYEHF